MVVSKRIFAYRYIFFFQMPCLPEWFLSRMDYKFLDNCFNGKKMGLRSKKLTKEEIYAYKAAFMQPGAV